MEITAKCKTAIKPQSLPPVERATCCHSLRVRQRVIQQKALMAANADRLEWEWKIHQNFFAQIMTDLEPVPNELLNFVVIVKQLPETLVEKIYVHVEKMV